jgi:hypothetical protein
VVKDGDGRGDAQLIFRFDGQEQKYLRRAISIPLQAAGK